VAIREPRRQHPADPRPGEERAERDDRRHHRQPVGAGEAEAEEHHVARHVRGEDLAEAEERDRVDQPGRERQDEQRARQRVAQARGALPAGRLVRHLPDSGTTLRSRA
jgi:hypothetical protein